MNENASIESVTDSIIITQAPILLLDTCAVLDIIRAPYREEIPDNVISSAIRLISNIQSQPRRLWMVSLSTVFQEFSDNITTVETELKRFIRRVDKDIVSLKSAYSFIGQAIPIDVFQKQRTSLPDELKRLANEILSNTVSLDVSQELKGVALDRALSCLPPSKKGSEQVKDCLIIEHYLKLCRRLREKCFDNIIVFTSSNIQDYCRGGKSLAPELKTEFDAVRLNYTTDFAWGISVLDIK
jgi:hypothetical protein